MTTTGYSADQLKELEGLNGKKIILQYVDPDKTGEEVLDAHGTLEVSKPIGLLFKPKGKTSGLIMAHQIVSVEADSSVGTSGDGKIRPKRLNPVEAGQVRQHLADRHGYQLSRVNELTDEAAASEHDRLHAADTAKEIGHFHRAKAVKAATPQAGEPAAA